VAADCFKLLKNGDSRECREREHSRCKKSVYAEQAKSPRCGYHSRISGIRVIRVQKFSDFPRNESTNPAEYFGEQPEMTPKDFGVTEGHNNKT
jgi:hypothetical protein